MEGAPDIDDGRWVVALGGNALQRERDDRSPQGQWAAARAAAEHVADLVAAGCRVVVTHGNGPQVGLALRRAERAEPDLPPTTIDIAVAETQGSLGYVLSRAIADALRARRKPQHVAAVVTQVRVAGDDPAFEQPSKPIGARMTRAQAAAMVRVRGWQVREGPGGEDARRWRRVVASPQPLEVLELPCVRALVDAGALVIAGGGGGIPVVRRNGRLEGVPAVVDKDLLSGLLARELGATGLILATDVEHVVLDYGQATERPLERLTPDEAERHLADGQFPPGSMGPKVQAALAFVRRGGRRAVICHIARIRAAAEGKAGTVIAGGQ